MTCSVVDCDRDAFCRGWCNRHYQRWYRLGDPLASAKRRPWQERFWEKVDRRGDDECWPWLAALSDKGYGMFNATFSGTGVAHRIAYMLLIGPVPDGLVLDHLCRVRHCVNPSHLEPVTAEENTSRGIRATQTHCKRGHEFTAENTERRPNGTRSCVTCVTTVHNPNAVRRARERRQASRVPMVAEFLGDEIRLPSIA